jgi:hypothetical protein
MADKPLLFISHITEEKEIAQAFKDMVEHAFLEMMEIFVSSDAASIPMGMRWLNKIEAALKRCVVEIVVCSPHSVTRPWINFEAGAVWIRDIPVIPLCHSGMTPSKLPVPLNMQQGATATDAGSIEKVLPVLAKALGSKTPAADIAGFVSQATTFEKNYLSMHKAVPAAPASGPSNTLLISGPIDCLAHIESWMGHRPAEDNTRAISYAAVDTELGLAPGCAKAYIEKAATRYNYVVRHKGEDVILFAKDPSSVRSSRRNKWAL